MGKNFEKHYKRKANAKLRKTCKAKVKYDSRAEASEASSGIASVLGQRFGQSPYLCSNCDGWHLTSKQPGN